MRRRLLLGVGANLYGQAVTVAVQLCTVPAFLHLWGGDRFGRWLTLLAWTSSLSLLDGGLLIAGGNAMTAAVARGERQRAGAIFVQAARWLLLIAALGGGVAALALAVAPDALFGGGFASEARLAAIALSIAALAGLPLGMAELGFRADAAYAMGLAGTSSVRLIEMGAALGAAAWGGGLAAAAAALLGVRICGAGAMTLLLRRRAAWVAEATSPWTWQQVRALARPALAALAVPAGLALSLQGTTIAAGVVLSGGAVATFVAARTLTRVLVQAIGLFNHALMPEMAMAVGRGEDGRKTALVRLNLAVVLGLLLPGWVVLVVLGPTLMERWTGGLLRPSAAFMALMATAAVLHGTWLSVSNLLLATNRQDEYAYHCLAITAAVCAFALVLGRTWGLEGLAAAGLVGECAMVLVVVPGQVSAALRAPFRPSSAGRRP